MATRSVHPRRRRMIRLIAAVAVVAPFAGVVPAGSAAAAELVSESDPAAAALKYRADAAKAPERKDPAAYCDSCTLYSGKPGSANGPCVVLGERLVAAKGWCTAWEGY